MSTPFASIDAALVRLAAPTDAPSVWPDLTGQDDQHVAHWRAWLSRTWSGPAVAEAIEVASPHLAVRVGHVCAGRLERPRRVRRVAESVVRYLLRWRTRATPFGLFAGVAPLHIAPPAPPWAQARRRRRPDRMRPGCDYCGAISAAPMTSRSSSVVT